MDPLSALRLASSSQMGGAAMPKMVQDMVGKQIPAAELEKLNQFAPAGETGRVNAMPSFGNVGGSGDSFSNVLGSMVKEVSAKQGAASDAVSGLISGQNVSLHQTMLAMEEASVSFQLMVEVRNKLLESYQEMMRMQI